MQVQNRQKKIPQRRCVGCNVSKDKTSLIRIVRTSEGEVLLDVTGKKSGRGAYICKQVSCLKKAQKGKRLEFHLDCSIPEEVYTALASELEEQTNA